MQPVYILSACAISPQHSFDPVRFLRPLEHTADGKLFVIDADYREYINPVAIRRMSRQLKIGITTGMHALKLADVARPDAIITGTGMGSKSDMEHFLKDMIILKEQALNPTYFIQSTYNSVNGWIAMQSKCTGYNQTYVHRGLSMELSLLDAQLLLNEASERQVVLAGGFDELSHEYFVVKSKVHYWTRDLPDSRQLLRHADTPGTIGGEGTAFFTLSNNNAGAKAALLSIRLAEQFSLEEMVIMLPAYLKDSGVRPDEIDMIIGGMNGDVRSQALYEEIFRILPQTITIVAFKHLTGEYPTASGFALWLAVQLLSVRGQELPEDIIYRKGSVKPVRYILIINHYILGTASFMLVRACDE